MKDNLRNTTEIFLPLAGNAEQHAKTPADVELIRKIKSVLTQSTEGQIALEDSTQLDQVLGFCIAAMTQPEIDFEKLANLLHEVEILLDQPTLDSLHQRVYDEFVGHVIDLLKPAARPFKTDILQGEIFQAFLTQKKLWQRMPMALAEAVNETLSEIYWHTHLFDQGLDPMQIEQDLAQLERSLIFYQQQR